MPLRRDPARPGWLTLVDGRGRPVGTFLRAERDGRPLADLFEAAIAPDEAVPAILAELRGWRVAADEPLARELLTERQFGPVLACSGVALDAGGTPVAASIVTGAPGEPPFGGPWVILVFRAPGHPGAGRALLARALRIAARDGLPGLGLAVTHGNPAARLYEDLGFRRILSGMSVDL